ncbi:MAG: hypothetical protein ACI81R_001272 [Bradymonadia bacterium]|jgi:hypothetical protein
MTTAFTQHFQVSDGAALFPAVERWIAASGLRGGWIRGFGSVSHCTFGGTGEPRQIGPAPELSLASLDIYFENVGSELRLRASAVVGIEAHGTHTTVAGELTAATALDVVLTLLSSGSLRAHVDDASPAPAVPSRASETVRTSAAKESPKKAARGVASPPAPSRASQVSRPSPAIEPKKRASAPASSPADWAQVSAMSEQLQSEADDEYANDIDVDELKPNDILLHPSLNRCLVVRVEGDDAVRVRVPNGSVRKLMMRPFRLIGTETARTFRIQKK